MELDHKLTFAKGNILNSDAELLVNPVNTIGVMGAGLAEQFKKKFPNNFKSYQDHCSKVESFKEYKFHATQEKGKHIFNFASKENWRNFSSLEYIRRSLIYLVIYLERHPVKSIAIPPVGCGLGGLAEKNVLHLILYFLRQVPYPLEIQLYGFRTIKPLVKTHILKHYDLSYRNVDKYTGVGSRELTKQGAAMVRDVANALYEHQYILSTGDAAQGCDDVFWDQTPDGYKKRYGPFGKTVYSVQTCVIDPEQPSYEIANRIAGLTHPAWRWIPDWMKELHTRNVFQVLGEQVNCPSEFLVCWTPDGAESCSETSKKTGGTGTAIRVADTFGVPVFNLQRSDAVDRLASYLGIEVKRIYTLGHLAKGS